MTEEALEIIRAAACGFAEGLIRASTAGSRPIRDVSARLDDKPGTAPSRAEISKDPAAQSDEEEYAAFIHATEGASIAPAPIEYGRPPEEIHAAMSALTDPIPQGHYDPQSPSEARPLWLADQP